jgi:hypothetical protein
MSARRIAVLIGSHDPAYFAGDRQSDRPREAAVLAALRAHPSRSDNDRPASATRIAAHDGRSVGRRTGARIGAGSRRPPAGAGPPRLRALAPERTRRPIRHTHEQMVAPAITDA